MGISYTICHWDIELYHKNQCKCILFLIPNILYLDFNFQINEIHIFKETSHDLFLARPF